MSADQDMAGQRDRLAGAGTIRIFADTVVGAVRKLVDAGLTPGKAARQLGIRRSTAYRIVQGRAGMRL